MLNFVSDSWFLERYLHSLSSLLSYPARNGMRKSGNIYLTSLSVAGKEMEHQRPDIPGGVILSVQSIFN